MRNWIVLGLLGIAATAGWTDSPIQWKGSRGWEANGTYCQLYDSKTVVTLHGMVQRVEKIVPLKGMGYGIHLILKTDTETIPVQMGPTWYVEKQLVHVLTNDVVEVTGSRVSCDGKPVILAAFVKKGDQTIKFRELKGTPAWTGMEH